MHTTTHTDPEGWKWHVKHNGDFSGHIVIDIPLVLNSSVIEQVDSNGSMTLTLPYSLVEAIARKQVVDHLIEVLEQIE